MVHTKLLFRQWIEELEHQIPNIKIGKIGDGFLEMHNYNVSEDVLREILALEEAKRKIEEEERLKAEEEAKRTYEEELEEQLTDEEITSFQLEKTDMDKMCNKVCEIIAGYENNGILQSNLWKKLKLSSRDGSRLALKLERMGMITREKILEKVRWTYKLIIKKIPISTKSIEHAPCLTCEDVSKCTLDGEISPRTCQWIEDWVLVELKNK